MTLEPMRYSVFAAERDVLSRLAIAAPLDSYLVEIGAHRGHTTVALAQAARLRSHRVLVIDPWDGSQDGAGDDVYRDFCQRIAPWPWIEVQRVKRTKATWPERVGFVFVDGDHRAPHDDLATAWAALMPGGVLVVHDADEPGWPAVVDAVHAFPVRPMYRFRYVPSEADLAVYGPSVRGLAWWFKP